MTANPSQRENDGLGREGDTLPRFFTRAEVLHLAARLGLFRESEIKPVLQKQSDLLHLMGPEVLVARRRAESFPKKYNRPQ